MTTVWCLGIIAVLVATSVLVAAARPDVGKVATWHNVVWGVTLALISTELVQYKTASTAAWLTLSTGILGFNLGVLLSPRRASPVDEEPRVGALVSRPQLVVMSVVYLIGFAVYLRVIASNYGLSTLVNDPVSIRQLGNGPSYLALVPFWARAAIFLGPLLFVVYAWRPAVRAPLPRSVRWCGVGVLAVSQLALLQRTNLFLAALWLVAVIVLEPNRKRLRDTVSGKRAVQVAVVGAVLFVVFQGIAGALGKSAVEATASGGVSPALGQSGMTSPYVYATSGTMAFLQLVDSRNHDPIPPPDPTRLQRGDYNPQTWGAATGYLALKAVPVAKPHSPIAPFIDVGVLTNVFTWLEPFYRDFRLVGVVLGSALLGAVTAALYSRRMVSTRAYWLAAAGLSCVFHAAFVAKFNSTIFIVGVLAVLFLSRAPRPDSTAPLGALSASRRS